ncbi:MAG: RNA-binding protein [Gammaproteobacteria bacterium]|nr:RNA-binding protein [Gammaproteobacteria bacterium]MYF39097.1 RNA-binding protein [Gammaproteobacteria bacterium]
MPTGPQGQSRPADTVQNAVHVAKIATGEIEETKPKPSGKARSGKAGGTARAKALSKERRSEIARQAAHARWS